MFIYAFGSICRGEVDFYSDIDLIAISNDQTRILDLDPNKFSIYSQERLIEYWKMGNPFAWHLYYESKLVYSFNEQDLIREWGEPSAYTNGLNDLRKFHNIFLDSKKQIELTKDSFLFDISTIFLSIRNFATCYSLAKGHINFHRNSALNLGSNSVPISTENYKILEQSRLLATRGLGTFPDDNNSSKLIECFEDIDDWMKLLLGDFK
ncbi:nucleotidyltransferase domain-containing protein [Acinetobacter soli]|uniref:nucleotidyltransferase domain-containing protein n=1 Tax=Acinetobacter soli TaxID=487316 RepID=UPI0028100253|nr:nucleotidyltransferase domain-containing protein [Acinetobacter soli]MDQ8994938.1 nucleotidyltransferase domain-containing protein [Acinetobacter soli]